MINEITQTMLPGKVYSAEQLSHLIRKPLRDVEPELSRLCECGRVSREDSYTTDGRPVYKLVSPS